MDDATTSVPEIPGSPDKAATPAQEPADVSTIEYSLSYQAEKPRLIRYLLHCGASYQTAEDVAQRALEELHKKWATVDKPGPWLRKVATRKLPRSRVSDEYPLEDHDQPGTMPDPASAAEILFEKDTVLSAIRRLPLKQRKVFALHFDRYEATEIAEILQMTPVAVRQNLARARARLKDLLTSEGADK